MVRWDLNKCLLGLSSSQRAATNPVFTATLIGSVLVVHAYFNLCSYMRMSLWVWIFHLYIPSCVFHLGLNYQSQVRKSFVFLCVLFCRTQQSHGVQCQVLSCHSHIFTICIYRPAAHILFHTESVGFMIDLTTWKKTAWPTDKHKICAPLHFHWTLLFAPIQTY